MPQSIHAMWQRVTSALIDAKNTKTGTSHLIQKSKILLNQPNFESSVQISIAEIGVQFR